MDQRLKNMGLGVLVIAVVLLGFGAWQTRTLGWDATTGRVESCKPNSTAGTSQTQECLVTWSAVGVNHAATVSFDGDTDLARTSRTVYVDGDDAYARTQGYLGPLLLG